MNHALKTVLPVKQKTTEKQQRTLHLLLTEEEARQQLAIFEKKHSTARARLLEALLEEKTLPYEVVTRKLNITSTVIRAMEELGILKVEISRSFRNPLKLSLIHI